MGILVSPTEPPGFRAIAQTVSMFPEKYGCDAIWRVHNENPSEAGWVGVQRKEIGDLLSSIRDGRLGQQLRQMAPLKMCMVVIEGKWRWSVDGELVEQRDGDKQGSRPWTKKQIAGVLWSIQAKGVWVYFTEDLRETIQAVQMFADWSGKEGHSGLESRSGPEGNGWGQVQIRDWQRHLLMGLPGIGGELATRILDTVGMPLGLHEDVVLEDVVGLGPKKIQGIFDVITGGE